MSALHCKTDSSSEMRAHQRRRFCRIRSKSLSIASGTHSSSNLLNCSQKKSKKFRHHEDKPVIEHVDTKEEVKRQGLNHLPRERQFSLWDREEFAHLVRFPDSNELAMKKLILRR